MSGKQRLNVGAVYDHLNTFSIGPYKTRLGVFYERRKKTIHKFSKQKFRKCL